MSDLHIRNQNKDRRLYFNRAVLAAVVATGLLLLLVTRMFILQVVDYQHYSTLADGNRVRVEPIPPTRGLIYDREGRVLAENLPTYQLELIPEQVEDVHQTIQALGEIIDIQEQDQERFFRLLDSQRRFQPVPIRQNLSDEEVARFSVERQRFPGVDIRARLARHYPYGEKMSHIVGYLGAISRQDLQRIDRSRYSGTTRIGKAGIEFSYEPILHGGAGSRRVETNAQGRVIRTLDVREPAVPGDDLYLSVDAELQRVAWNALEGHSGAVVALDPRDGSVLAKVSRPAFDPNRLVAGLQSEAFRDMQNDPERPLFNRATRGRYPPGSTIKPFLALAGMDATDVDPDDTINCTGEFHLEGRDRPFRDWLRRGHGPTDLHKAVVESCDIYFYKLAMELGINNIHRYLTQFGLGAQASIDIPGESAGVIPSREWKRRTMGEGWYHGETVIAGIGQGYMLSTPLQLAKATAGMANHGYLHNPRILMGTRNAFTREYETMSPPEAYRSELLAAISDTRWERAIDAMVDSVHGERGTARSIGFSSPYSIAGKTGTAQVFGLEEDEEYDHEGLARHLRDHALFIAFAPAENPTIAISVLVEHGGGGGSVAAPVAQKVMDYYLLKRNNDDQAGNDDAD
ncbi:penicillin-binding protein 2 [Natronospira proteinivora]|uniref:Peptidoglycan D,D-transpeptidase MrdA n=1 Tax=Natronospira proteinivora TaxID=1807133 RepID=A0ABT1G7U0_9GAMM|nr:penicillin-binding protein 2 [Natronospira proteinivora]MCP1727378.1 penicillin-binding protein 2 [Natronospira proteinivora]